MKVLGSEKGALGSAEAAPGKKNYMLCTQALAKKVTYPALDTQHP